MVHISQLISSLVKISDKSFKDNFSGPLEIATVAETSRCDGLGKVIFCSGLPYGLPSVQPVTSFSDPYIWKLLKKRFDHRDNGIIRDI